MTPRTGAATVGWMNRAARALQHRTQAGSTAAGSRRRRPKRSYGCDALGTSTQSRERLLPRDSTVRTGSKAAVPSASVRYWLLKKKSPGGGRGL
jgi:hypothetical protein